MRLYKEVVDVHLDLVDAVKSKILCDRLGLPFPDGISFLINKVVQQDGDSIKGIRYGHRRGMQ